MKTVFRNLIMSLAVLGGFLMTTPVQAERTIGWNLLGGDTFKLGTVDVAERWDAATQQDVFEDDYSASQYREAYISGTPTAAQMLVGSMPEQRDKDFVFTQAQIQAMNSASPNIREWRGSSSLVFGDGGGNNGFVKLADGATGGHSAYLELVEHPSLGGTFIVEGDVRSPSAGSVARLAMLKNDNLTGTESFRDDNVAPIWIRFEEFVTTTGSDFDSFNKRYTGQQVAMICLWSGDFREEFFYLPLDSTPNETLPSELATVLAAYNPGGFNRIWLEWFGGNNTIDLRVNNVAVPFLTGYELTEEFENDDFRAMGFMLSGGAELDRFAATPEPSSMVMMCFGMLFFGMQNRRRRRRGQKLGLTSSITA